MNPLIFLAAAFACTTATRALRLCSDEDIQSNTTVCRSDALSFLTLCNGACGSGGILQGWYDVCTDEDTGQQCSRLVQCQPQCNHGRFSEVEHRCVCEPGYTGECCDREIDVCSTVAVIKDDGARSILSKSSGNCDWFLPVGWYRFDSPAGDLLPESFVSPGSCGTLAPLYMDGKHPGPDEDVVHRRVCGAHGDDPCHFKLEVEVKNCGEFMAYKLQPATICPMAYCLTKKLTSHTSWDIGKFQCPESDGFYEHPETFRRFIRCANKKPYVIRCPNYTLYNPVKNICDWPRNLDKKVLNIIKMRRTALQSHLKSIQNNVFQGLQTVQSRVSEGLRNIQDRESQRLQKIQDRLSQGLQSVQSNLAETRREVDNEVNAVVGDGSYGVPGIPSITVSTQQEPGVKCPERYGVFEHPSDTHKFISCTRSVPTVKVCPNGSVFYQLLRMCAWD